MKKKPRAPLISSRLDWIALEILILFVATVVYTVIIWQAERASAQTTLDVFKSTVKEVVPFFQFALIYVIGSFEIGGEIMLRFTSKMEEARKAGREEGLEAGREEGLEVGREEGVAQGRIETYRAWADWNQRREAAVAKGAPFNEPPPPNPENAREE